MPFSTAMCHIKTLEDAGFVRKVVDGYEIGPQLPLIWAGYKKRLKDKIDQLNHEDRMSEV